MFTPTYSTITLTARDKISMGDLVVILWKNYVRRAESSDLYSLGQDKVRVAETNAKKGEKVEIFDGLNMMFKVDVKAESA